MSISEKIKAINKNIGQNKAQYDLDLDRQTDFCLIIRKCE